ncbi:chemotaxis protein CheA [Sulfuriflexus mobilis]|uniref:chemotaxis protein CheA n=1 Tax=Sulfuriflexus mobilis TaxID=1811807 RepID=UPI000F828DDD|nr:chemotaxis protein CheA [Sulfuriflexus mobilis]
MSFDADDEILQDFLVEAGEILEQLGGQLVDLEQSSGDSDLLNAVFRGFHTIKGGASFLSLEPLVQLCHRAEDVFNALRNGERSVDAQLMDIILPVLDSLNDMFDRLKAGEYPPDADPAQLQALDALLQGDSAPAAAEPVAVSADAADDEFEAILEAAQDKPAAVADTPAATSSDEISDDEFEALLDELHGKGQFSAVPDAPEAKVEAPKPTGDMISDDEFEALLDELHGQKAAPGAKPDAPEVAAAEPAAAKPAEKAPPPEAVAEKPAAKPAAAREAAAPQGETTVRVDTKRLDDIMNLVGELVLVRNRLSTLQSTVENEHVSSAVANLDVVTADLQNAVMKTRMQPIKKVFGRFPRVVRDLARALNKEIVLEMEGEDTDLDKNLVEALADPLVHLVRNAVDHGIEMPDARETAGKSRAGTVLLKASQEGDHIELTIADDGGGMDPDKLRGIAVSKGLMDTDAAGRLSDHECYNLIFAPGFSTKEQISDISGRGVGMDVVKTRIVQLNGSVEIDSKLGEGSSLVIKVPLTLAIMPTLMVVLGEQAFALPLVNVCEIFDLDLSKTNIVDGQQVVVVRDKPLPLYYLSEWLVEGRSRADRKTNGHVVIVGVGTQRVGFVVDELLGQEEVVIKPLGKMIQGTDGLAGATITGDGNIALILDVPGLLKAYARKY